SSSLGIGRADRLRMLTTLCRITSSTRTLRISSSSWARSSSSDGCSAPPPAESGGSSAPPAEPPLVCSSATDGSLRCVGFPRLLHGTTVDLLDRGSLGEARVGPLRPVALGQVDLQAQGLASRLGPGHDSLQDLASRDHPALPEIDHLPVHPRADGAPQVLLDL